MKDILQEIDTLQLEINSSRPLKDHLKLFLTNYIVHISTTFSKRKSQISPLSQNKIIIKIRPDNIIRIVYDLLLAAV